jgi:CRP-like cAMP-binding protein
MVAPQKSVPKNFVLKKGSLVGDFPSLLHRIPSRSAVKCISKGKIMVINADNLRTLVESFPSILVYLHDKFLVF